MRKSWAFAARDFDSTIDSGRYPLMPVWVIPSMK
jgi:hypothetical protein